MLNIDSLIFDLDGTLIDSKEDIVKTVNFTLSQLGLNQKKPAEIISFIGTGADDLVKKSLGKENSHLFDKAVLIFKDFFKEHFLKENKLYPYAEEILEYFKHKNMYIVTNREKDTAEAALNNSGIYNYFKGIIGGEDVSCRKPSSCPLNKIIKSGLDRNKTIIIGDMDLDILSGKEAGILTCAAAYGIGERKDLLKAKPDYIIESLPELKKIIN
jgi:phosphoglycolate phosphatase